MHFDGVRLLARTVWMRRTTNVKTDTRACSSANFQKPSAKTRPMTTTGSKNSVSRKTRGYDTLDASIESLNRDHLRFL